MSLQTMDDLIDATPSIEQFYDNAVIIISGGTGFLGKILVEKLLRSFDVKKIYLLIRSKNYVNVDDRLQNFFKESVSANFFFFCKLPNQHLFIGRFSINFENAHQMHWIKCLRSTLILTNQIYQ